jgi:broad specificity phosphatase PhoE
VTRRIDRRGLLLLGLVLAAGGVRAAGWPSGPRVHAIMRHALAPGTGDPPGFRLDDPSTQRNLSDAGRAQARAIGATLRDRRAGFDAVWSSRWRRCVESAELLGLGPVTPEPALDSFFEERAEGPARTAALRARLMALDPGRSVMMVTHQVNAAALTGVSPASGEIVVTALGEDGAVSVVDRLRLAAPG